MFESKPLQFDVVVILTKTTTWMNIQPFHRADGKQFLCCARLSVHISFECVILNTRYSFHIRSWFHLMKLHHKIYLSLCVFVSFCPSLYIILSCRLASRFLPPNIFVSVCASVNVTNYWVHQFYSPLILYVNAAWRVVCCILIRFILFRKGFVWFVYPAQSSIGMYTELNQISCHPFSNSMHYENHPVLKLLSNS